MLAISMRLSEKPVELVYDLYVSTPLPSLLPSLSHLSHQTHHVTVHLVHGRMGHGVGYQGRHEGGGRAGKFLRRSPKYRYESV